MPRLSSMESKMTREEAVVQGVKRYVGKPCQKHGPTAERSVCDNKCIQCSYATARARRERQDPETKAQRLEAMRAYTKKRRKDPVVRAKAAIRSREWFQSNSPKAQANRKRAAERNRRVRQDPERVALQRSRRKMLAQDPERRARVAEYDRERKKKTPRSVTRGYGRKYKYGVTVEQFAAQLEIQNHKCGNPGCDSNVNQSSPLDHDHKTGRPRGILCRHCNTLEGAIAKHKRKVAGLMKYRAFGGVWDGKLHVDVQTPAPQLSLLA